jgi:hypothetical protein
MEGRAPIFLGVNTYFTAVLLDNGSADVETESGTRLGPVVPSIGLGEFGENMRLEFLGNTWSLISDTKSGRVNARTARP